MRKDFAVGVRVMIIDGRKLLLGKMSCLGYGREGMWGLFGGHLEQGETFEQSAIREIKEELNIDLECPEVFCVQNDMHASAHWISIGLVAHKWKGEIVNSEQNNCAELAWFDLDSLPENIYPPNIKIIEKFKKGQFYM